MQGRCFVVLLIAWFLPLDAFSQRVIATIAVGNRPTYLAVDPKTDRVYVSNQSDDSVSVIDGGTNSLLTTVRVGHSPNGIAVNPKTNRIYVANLNSGTLSIINGDKLTTSTLRVGLNPAKVAVNSVSNRVYVTLENQDGSLAVIDGKNRKVETTISLPPYPLSVAVDSRSNRIYVADFLCGCGEISVVDGATNELIDAILLPRSSMVEGVALDLKHQVAYATDENSGFYVIDLASGEILGEVGNLDNPNEVNAIPGTTVAVEPDTGSDHAVFIDASMLGIKKRVRVGKFPTGVAVNPRTRRVYVANRQDNTVSVIQFPHSWLEFAAPELSR